MLIAVIGPVCHQAIYPVWVILLYSGMLHAKIIQSIYRIKQLIAQHLILLVRSNEPLLLLSDNEHIRNANQHSLD